MTLTTHEPGADPSQGPLTVAGPDSPTGPPAAGREDAPGRSEDPFWGWAWAVVIASVAFFLRRWHLGQPHEFSFDETYYAKDAWSLLNNGYIRTYVDGADEAIMSGDTMTQWNADPSMAVHPDVGKWLIALGEQAFGMDPYGWRIASAVVGALMVLVMCRFVKRVSGSTLLGLFAGLLLAVDGLQFVLSRLALLDIFIAFFVLCGVHCVVADRQWLRARFDEGATRALARPWLVLGGVSFGLAVGTKWSAAYALAAFGLMVWLWSWGARRAAGHRGAWWRSVVLDGVPAFVQLVGVALVVYVVSWSGWLMHAGEYERTLSNTQYTTFEGGEQWPTATEPDAEGLGEVTQSLRSLWYYHQDVYTFHTEFLNDSTHPYQSSPASWLVIGRPVGVSTTLDVQPGTQGCEAPAGSDCLRQVILLGNPVVWWTGCVAMLLSLAMWVLGRDWRHGVAVVGLAATWLPWFAYDDRPVYYFYAIASLPFLVLSIALGVGTLMGSRPSGRRRLVGVVVGGLVATAATLAFGWFWPVWTNQLLTHGEWLDRMWFTKWI
ncbi:MAG: dolichyl-phosphate-mannose--protein mannosyltransferase [Nocardioides sp.]|uniref:dolichyl-phosphate-mannose--protein mannosyltransferase n=1 Tax=Nocardioides sp. TaxID=35761 RepID=UPI003EFF7D63